MSLRSNKRRSLVRVSHPLRRLHFEPLEHRQLLAVYTVDSLADNDDNNFGSGQFTLREAIGQANLTPVTDTISFGPAVRGQITLSGPGLAITEDLTINGPGANLLAVSGNDAVRVFYLYNFSNPVVATISGLTITKGRADGLSGGGIATDAGSNLTLKGMEFFNNTASEGGGVVTINAKLTVLNSTFNMNSAVLGAGIYHVHNAPQDPAHPTLQVINSTLYQGSASTNGGGIYLASGAALLRNSTVARNYQGGGVFIGTDGNSSFTIYNTLISTNHDASGTKDISSGNIAVASSHNLIGDAGSAGGLTHGANGNIVGNSGSGVSDPNRLFDFSLAYNGGSTRTLALRTGSAALDAGDNSLAVDQDGAALTSDQRGFTRTYDGADADTTATVDIGAYEATKRAFVVNTLDDENDGNYGADKFSLREALERANANAGPDVIIFKAGLTGAILLAGTDMFVDDSITINGPGPDKLAIGGSLASRLFYINASVIASISGLELRDGNSQEGYGGAVYISGGARAILDRLYIHNCRSHRVGGAIYSVDGTLTLSNSTLSNNSAGALGISGAIGGAIAFDNTSSIDGSPDLVVINSTVSGNSADLCGGVAAVRAAAIYRNSTIVNNSNKANTEGGGLFIDYQSTATLYNTIVAGNTRQGIPSDITGIVDAASFNSLIGDAASAGGLTNGTNGNLVGIGGAGTRPLDTIVETNLANNGGTIPTHKLAPSSPAIDKGKNAYAVDRNGAALTTDQRGIARIADREIDGVATVDMGAVELRPFAVRFSGTSTYTENGDPLVLAPSATFTALESTTFSGGKLTITNAVAPHSDDRLTILHQGTEAGQVNMSGNDVRFNGILIGVKTGGSGATPLVVAFSANAWAAAIQAVIRRVAFNSVSDNPPTAARSIRFAMNDGHGSFSRWITTSVGVVRVNDKPAITNLGGAVTYLEDTPAISIAPTATVSDLDSFNFEGGRLSARIIANSESTDRVSIRSIGDVSTSGSEVIVGGQVIGTLSGGSGSAALIVTFNANATVPRVKSVLQAVAFQNTSQNPSSATRTLSVFVSDGDGGVGDTSTKSINVTPKNDIPVLGGISGSVGYTRNAAAFVLAGSATVSDVDSANVDGGRLRVRVDPSDPSNRLSIAGSFTVDASNNVLLGGVVIGKRIATGFGAAELIVTFNANATKAIVQQLVRAITFKTVAGRAGSRNVIFTVSDGDGGLSAEATKTVNVS